MKSITEQASSVAKAIQKGWEKAGKPKEFSVKIFEEEQTNFFGFSTQPAKVGIFFDQAPIPSQKSTNSVRPRRETPSARPPQQKPSSNAKSETPSKSHSIAPSQETRFENKVEKQQEVREIWNEALLQQTRVWLEQLMKQLDLSTINFKLEAQNYDLAITFDKPLVPEPNRQQQLYRSISLLLMQTLRHKMHRPLRGFRVSINH